MKAMISIVYGQGSNCNYIVFLHAIGYSTLLWAGLPESSQAGSPAVKDDRKGLTW
jgi:hypothetical protein